MLLHVLWLVASLAQLPCLQLLSRCAQALLHPCLPVGAFTFLTRARQRARGVPAAAVLVCVVPALGAGCLAVLCVCACSCASFDFLY